MKYYKLLTDTFSYEVGSIFNFNAKHAFMASLPFAAQRKILWEEISRDEAKEKGHYFLLNGEITNFNNLDMIRALH